jgi:hypothetical protein
VWAGGEKDDHCLKKKATAGHRWLTPVILATQEAKIGWIEVRSQPGQIVHETLSRKTLHKNKAGGVAQGIEPEFKPQYRQNKQTNQQQNVCVFLLVMSCVHERGEWRDGAGTPF